MNEVKSQPKEMPILEELQELHNTNIIKLTEIKSMLCLLDSKLMGRFPDKEENIDRAEPNGYLPLFKNQYFKTRDLIDDIGNLLDSLNNKL